MKYFIFIAAQFFLLLFLFLTGPIFIPSLPFSLIQIFSIFFICWALLERMRNKKKGGPYEFIRHPIYAGILLFVASAVQGEFTFLRLLDFLLFLFLIILKIKRDEQLMLANSRHESKKYFERTKKLIPYIY
jgi:protein-S-isoprenylcysteine O-methyltransferase Ste14